MRVVDGQMRFSATDLANHLACRHLTSLDHASALGTLRSPSWQDPALAVLQERGFRHEAAYLDHLESEGLSVLRPAAGEALAVAATAAAMRDGADVITQATLAMGRWYGRADVLWRIDRPSDLGAWSYEVTDTKLAHETRAGTILQVCLYSELVGAIQGVSPEYMYVVTPATGYTPEAYRFADFAAYHRHIQSRLETSVDEAAQASGTYPEPVPQCDICRWWPRCNDRRRADDLFYFVAGISRSQRMQLNTWGVETLTGLAGLALPLDRQPRRGARESYERVREQARVQLLSRDVPVPVYEVLELEPEQGLARLPEPDAGDVFFDIEGDAFVGESGHEYLFGWATPDGNDVLEYEARWALAPGEERQLFESFVDTMIQRWARYPRMHIYHFAPYEPGTLKRLMGRYAAREDEIDRMLRAGLFVDLYGVVRQGVRVGVERYRSRI